jgi:tetratricopeptide (TPR) repeat protein
MARKLGIDVAVVRLLLEVSIMCSQLGRYDQARSIGAALARFRSDLPQPRTVIGASLMWQGQLPEALRELEATLREFPNCQLTKALLGMAYGRAGRAGGERLLKEVIDDGRDEWAIRFAREALGFDYRGAPARRAAARPGRAIYG